MFFMILTEYLSYKNIWNAKESNFLKLREENVDVSHQNETIAKHQHVKVNLSIFISFYVGGFEGRKETTRNAERYLREFDSNIQLNSVRLSIIVMDSILH